MSVKLVLLCKEGEARQAYLKEAKTLGLEVAIVSTFAELFQAMISTPYQGVMIDLITSMKASKEEKGIAQEILSVFPIVQLKWEGESKTIRTISFGKTFNSGSLLEFIKAECETFAPRSIRLDSRKSINFNVVMSSEESMNEAFREHSVTINFSRGGCFLFSCANWSKSKNVWFIINELQDKTPIAGDIRWAVAWGKTMMIPGFGISLRISNPDKWRN
jgi:hypothetical protein